MFFPLDDHKRKTERCTIGKHKCFFFPQLYIILSEVCHEQGLPEKYGLADCCAKADAERNECFLSHKNSTPGFIPPFKKPDPEEGCKQYQEHRDELLGL